MTARGLLTAGTPMTMSIKRIAWPSVLAMVLMPAQLRSDSIRSQSG